MPEGKSYDELKVHKSDPQLHSICVPLTSVAEEFQLNCYKYFLKCYCKLASMPSRLFDEQTFPAFVFNHLVKNFSEENLTRLAKDLFRDPEPLHEVITLILEEDTCPENPDDSRMFEFNLLQRHMEGFYLNVSSIATGGNFEEMENIFDDGEENNQLKILKNLEIPCDIMKQQILQFKREKKGINTPMLDKLSMILQNPENINWEVEGLTALVLVQERKEAIRLSKTLQQMDFVNQRPLRVTHLVGHGKGTKDNGMDVQKQESLLRNLSSFNILVATSIAEEGIDIVELGLVISMNPPKTVRALVQMCGRARKKDSHFFILCDSVEAKDKVDRLIKQEGNMIEAAKLCVAADKELNISV